MRSNRAARWLTFEEANPPIHAARSRHVYLFTQLMLATAVRPEAILDLRWNAIDFNRGLIRLNP